jgi:hypothetical protein
MFSFINMSTRTGDFRRNTFRVEANAFLQQVKGFQRSAKQSAELYAKCPFAPFASNGTTERTLDRYRVQIVRKSHLKCRKNQ